MLTIFFLYILILISFRPIFDSDDDDHHDDDGDHDEDHIVGVIELLQMYHYLLGVHFKMYFYNLYKIEDSIQKLRHSKHFQINFRINILVNMAI